MGIWEENEVEVRFKHLGISNAKLHTKDVFISSSKNYGSSPGWCGSVD